MVKIVTDSAGDIPKRLAEDLDITIVPARVLFGRRSFRDGIDLSANDFYTRLEQSKYHPNTTQAAPLDFYRAFREIEKSGEDILCISLPENLSALIRSAREGAEEIEKVRIEIYNSGMVSGGQGLLVVAAARMAAAGFGINRIITQLNQLKPKTTLYSVAATLDYLKRGGRITAASHRIGSLLGVRPIITVENETVEAVERQLFGNMEKAMDKIIAKMKENYMPEEELEVFILHAQNIAGATTFADKVQNKFNIKTMTITRIGATIGANVGPGAIGVAAIPTITYL